ncbi:MAG: Panacea domain-containing protein [Pseudohongiellaceae bacterium]
MYDSRQVANWFITCAVKDDRPLTIMVLVKLVYIAHGWHLALRDKPLVSGPIEAWRHGPVVVDVYKTFRPKVKGNTITRPDKKFGTIRDPDDCFFLQKIYNSYTKKEAWELSYLTHSAGGPWDVARNEMGLFVRIPDDLIRKHYLNMLQRADQSEAMT